MSFDGMVKATKEDLQTALRNIESYSLRVDAALEEAVSKSKIDTKQVSYWVFFKKTITVYEYMSCNFYYFAYMVSSNYPDIFPTHYASFKTYGMGDEMRSVEKMYDLNSNEVYLTPSQAKAVVKWKEISV